MKGWIPVHRQLQEHWLWADKPFSKGQAWIDMLMLANHDDNKFLLGNELVEVKTGSFITSELKLMERWGWGKAKTRAFLDLLQKDGMITKISDRKKTTIIVENYSVYALCETTAKPQTDRKQTTNRPQADTNNNYNNDNNDKQINIYTVVVDYLNEKAGTSYRATTKKTKEVIHARLAEGFTVEDFKTVIDKKCSEWIGTEFEQYLRPATLFGTKFESYLNAKVVTKKQNKPDIDESKTDLDEFF
jgi:uncharacterized phage protein (TIGR02220 family)